MTETECVNCDYSETCDWSLIKVNFTPMSPPCTSKAWHDKSLKTFEDMTVNVRKKLTVGEFYKNCQRDYMDVI